MRVEFQPAFVLHTRPFRDTSLLLDCLTEDFGRLGLVAKGARARRSRQRQFCQPFRPLLISWQGRGNLKTLVAIEPQSQAKELQGLHLYSGLYLNELLTRVLLEGNPCVEIYHRYSTTLEQLQLQVELEPLLRKLELGLLADLGYGVDLQRESIDGALLQDDASYIVVAEQGLVRAASGSDATVFHGRCLLEMARGDFSQADTRRQAKQLTRRLLQPLLGDKPLKSRELFASSVKKESS